MLADRDAAARELEEGKLLLQMLEGRLERAQQKLEMTKEQIVLTRKLIISDISPLIVERLREKSLHYGRIFRKNDSEATTRNVSTSLDSDSDWEDEESGVSSSSSKAGESQEYQR